MSREDTIDRLIKEMAAVKDRLRHLELAEPETPSCLLTRAQTGWTRVTGATYGAIPFDLEIRDRSGMHESVTNPQRITLLHAGLYLVVGVIAFDSNKAGYRGLAIYHNTSRVATHEHPAIDGRPSTITISEPIFAAAGDYFRLACMQTSGGDLDVLQNTYSPFFGAFKVTGG